MFNLHSLFKFFNSDRPYIPANQDEWPDAWKKVEYKVYSRMPKIKLPKPSIGDIAFEEVILKRKSEREFSQGFLNQNELSSLLFFGGGIIRGNENSEYAKRAYPSGGARYPIETYLILRRAENIKPGIYHYNVLDHALEFLIEEESEMTGKLFPYEFAQNAAVVFIFTFMPARSVKKYGNLALKIGLIEAGHLAENIYLVSIALDLKCSALGAIRENIACSLLDIDGMEEIPFYALACGK